MAAISVYFSRDFYVFFPLKNRLFFFIKYIQSPQPGAEPENLLGGYYMKKISWGPHVRQIIIFFITKGFFIYLLCVCGVVWVGWVGGSAHAPNCMQTTKYQVIARHD